LRTVQLHFWWRQAMHIINAVLLTLHLPNHFIVVALRRIPVAQSVSSCQSYATKWSCKVMTQIFRSTNDCLTAISLQSALSLVYFFFRVPGVSKRVHGRERYSHKVFWFSFRQVVHIYFQDSWKARVRFDWYKNILVRNQLKTINSVLRRIGKNHYFSL
jgi:hypothetical protein